MSSFVNVTDVIIIGVDVRDVNIADVSTLSIDVNNVSIAGVSTLSVDVKNVSMGGVSTSVSSGQCTGSSRSPVGVMDARPVV